MSALLDTHVVSEIRKPNGDPTVKSAVAALGGGASISVITIGEISKGAHRLAPSQRQRELLAWLDRLQNDFHRRILHVDVRIAQLWGQLTARAQRQGRQIAAPDGLIAATALHHELAVMTRNVNDFAPTGVQIVNPWPK